MKRKCLTWAFIGLLVIAPSVLPLTARAAPPETIQIDGNSTGRRFDGIGAASAGASSRLLIDYPEPQRSQILDYLFKPNYGAAFQHLKVEVGGDVNSTDGCEPSHMHIRTEENDDRGYEWWLMQEAQKRNPDIILDCLAWGAPAWIGDGKYYSKDMADYLVRFLLAGRKKELKIRYVGVWNERGYDAAWIKLLRKTLDQARLSDVGIVAADEVGKRGWEIVQAMASDAALKSAVSVVGVHYPKFASTQPALDCGKPLWSSEDGPWNGTWGGARQLAKIYNRNYIIGKMTATEIWSPITSYYDNLPLPGSGVMKANTPWSGYYQVQPALWATAQVTQFIQPGWTYLDSACILLDGGSVVAAKSPDGKDVSIIIESTEAKQPTACNFQISNGLRGKPLHVWKTDKNQQMVEQLQIVPADGAFSITVDPECIYSLTTTVGQHKGDAQPPQDQPFAADYTDDFESDAIGGTPRFTSDQAGIFEVVARADGKGKSLRQIIDHKGIEWQKNPLPETILGSPDWNDYDTSADVLIEGAGSAAIFGRVGRLLQNADPPPGYCLRITSAGDWRLNVDQTTHPSPKKTAVISQSLASGKLAAPAAGWHNLQLSMNGATIDASIDGKPVAHVSDFSYSSGMIALGSDWSPTQFDNLHIRSIGK